VVVRVRKEFPVDLPAAYAWLTDIQDDDVERTDAVLAARKVRERSKDRIVYEGETMVLGRRNWAVTEVHLMPPDRWRARVVEGPRLGSATDYHLAPTARGCEITVTYGFVLIDPRRHLLLRIAKPLVRRELVKMWDGFEKDLRRELAPPA
jgi:hypothetical protein